MTPTITSLANISMVMSDGYKFVFLKTQFEQWEKEANEGNRYSQQLIDMVFRFEKLINLASANRINTES